MAPNEPEKHLIEHAGRRVAWHCAGAGRPLLLLHGGFGSWRHWERNLGALAAGHRLLVPDLPGYGESDDPQPDDLGGLLAATIATLDAQIGVGVEIDIAAFSFGAVVAAHVAAQRGAVRRLALVGPTGHGGRRRSRGELQSWRAAAASGDAEALAGVMRTNLWLHMLYADESIDAQALDIHTEACLRTRFRSRAISRAGGVGQVLARHAGPLLVAWGEHDITAFPEEAGAALRGHCPQAAIRVIEGAGHWAQFERAEAVERMLADFLAA